MDIDKLINSVSRHWRLLTGVLVAGLVVYFLSVYGFIKVEVAAGQSNQELTFSLSSGGKASTHKTKSSSFSKIVRKSTYEVVVSQDSQAAMAVVKTKGFLGSQSTKLTLAPEKARSFAGEGPEACMYMTGGALYSYTCGDSFSKVKTHVPASASAPTYKIQRFGAPVGRIEAIVEGGARLLLGPEHDNQTHTLYQVAGDGTLTGGRTLPDLAKDKSYQLAPYLEGYVAYSSGFDHLLYYKSFDQKPEIIEGISPKDRSFVAATLSVWGGQILAVFHDDSSEVLGDEEFDPKAGSTELVLVESGKTTRQTIKGRLRAAQLCGASKLCHTESNRLQVSSLSGDKLRRLYVLSGVSSAQTLGSSFLVVKDGAVYAFDTEKQTGTREYSLGSYSFCGLQPAGSNYLLCAISAKGNRLALLINRSAANTDSIDKKAALLEANAAVSNLSIQGSYIFVGADFGPEVYDKDNRSFGYDPARAQQVRAGIDQLASQLGIDRNIYKLRVNPAQ